MAVDAAKVEPAASGLCEEFRQYVTGQQVDVFRIVIRLGRYADNDISPRQPYSISDRGCNVRDMLQYLQQRHHIVTVPTAVPSAQIGFQGRQRIDAAGSHSLKHLYAMGQQVQRRHRYGGKLFQKRK